MTTTAPTFMPTPDDESGRRHNLRCAALSDPAVRQELYHRHPVVCNSLMVITDPVRQVYEAIAQSVVHRTPGSPFIGDFRMGKTRTIGAVRRQLQKTFPNVPVALLIAKQHDNPSERAFFGDVLNDFRHSAALSGSAAERRLRLLTIITSAAMSMGSDRYVIFIDEGQNWDLQEYVWLRDLTNDLVERGVVCIVIVFGHSELNALRDRVISSGRTDLLGRFFLTPRPFRGLSNVAELRKTLEAFDRRERHEFPEGSGVCMAEFFMPVAFEDGWRMAAEADDLWAAFQRVASRRGRTAGNIGMQWVMSTIRSMLFSGMDADAPGFKFGVETLVQCVESSEYESSLQ
ncbi:hypothetical protein LXT12_20580 [Pelomonas sp. P7]|uniref:ORC1/DEAH AAA+ ATPase domain-containing protein n=1 Tax=Pelomonas caseinilytica TaxID=2906763 RepID=A0ABS8XL45_9BURK|nr:AAA family ATPase [Pelomonas sp. P7]MCE4539652.1 hypothetical protein [Pelomonas sp. P7]